MRYMDLLTNNQKIIQGNCWKEIQDEIPDILEDLSGIVLVTHRIHKHYRFFK